MAALSAQTDFVEAGRGRRRLGIAVVVVGLIWGIVLPELAQVGTVRKHIEFLEERHIDASAMYYTELDKVHFIGRD